MDEELIEEFKELFSFDKEKQNSILNRIITDNIVKGDKPSSANEILSVIAGRVKTECEKALLKIPRISIEPGRVIVGPAMVTIYKVGTTKEVTLSDGSTRWYVSVEVGSVNVPVLLIVEITGEVSVLLVSVKVLDAVATVTPSMVTVPAAERAIVVSVA